MAPELPTADRIAAGQAVYTPRVLKWYDLWVVRAQNRFLWGCSSWNILALYDRHLSACHLDIGVGTGFFLNHARFPVEKPQITLLDLNRHCLDAAAKRLARYKPETVQADVFAPFPVTGPFRSAGLSLLLHCLPGDIKTKAVVFDHLRTCLAPGAAVFGATVVQGSSPRSRAAQRLLDLYNTRGIFSNADDTVEDLRTALESRFDEARVELIGCMALFSAREGGR